MNNRAQQPVTLLIGALGGEGGGLLTNWVTAAATASGIVVQSTSVPGVAQRTGATAYYVELFPAPAAPAPATPASANSASVGDAPSPVFALFPNPGMVDVMVASELMEAGRAMERGFVTPDRTTLIASTHRIYAIGEKSSPSDGRFDAERVTAAAGALAKARIMFDMEAAARDNATTLNAVVLGCLARCGILPVARDAFENAIRDAGKAVEANLRGFVCGFEAASAAAHTQLPEPPVKRRTIVPAAADGPLSRVRTSYPPALRDTVEEAVARLTDYQGRAYATHYLHRLDTIHDTERAHEGDAFGFRLTNIAARQLAVWMSYEDVIRVADLKTRAARLQRLRREVGVAADVPLRVTEILKPGIEEWCGMLPGVVGGPLLRWAERHGHLDRFNLGLHIRTSSVVGFLRLYLLGRLRWWRPFTHRFQQEQRAIDLWLDTLRQAVACNYRLACAVAELPGIRKGYGETRRRGVDKYSRILNAIVRPALAGRIEPALASDGLRRAIAQAREDADDAAFDQLLAPAATPDDPELEPRHAAE